MSQEWEDLPVSEPIESLPWREVWMQALTQPAVSTYERLLQDPQATVRRAYTWVAVAALIAYFIYLPLNLILTGTWQEGMLAELLGSLALCGICGAVVIPLLSVLGFVISAGFTHLVARALGGTGTYPEIAYAYATYQAPLALVSFFRPGCHVFFLVSNPD